MNKVLPQFWNTEYILMFYQIFSLLEYYLTCCGLNYSYLNLHMQVYISLKRWGIKNVIDLHFHQEDRIRALWVRGSSLMCTAQSHPSPLSRSRSQALRSIFLAVLWPQRWAWYFLPESSIPAAFVFSEFFAEMSKTVSLLYHFTSYIILLMCIKHHALRHEDAGSICYTSRSKARRMVTLRV